MGGDPLGSRHVKALHQRITIRRGFFSFPFLHVLSPEVGEDGLMPRGRGQALAAPPGCSCFLVPKWIQPPAHPEERKSLIYRLLPQMEQCHDHTTCTLEACLRHQHGRLPNGAGGWLLIRCSKKSIQWIPRGCFVADGWMGPPLDLLDPSISGATGETDTLRLAPRRAAGLGEWNGPTSVYGFTLPSESIKLTPTPECR